MISGGDLCMLNAGSGGESQSCESSFRKMKPASARVKLWFRTVLWVFAGCSGASGTRWCRGIRLQNNCLCVFVSDSFFDSFICEWRNVPCSFRSDMLPTRWLRLAPSPSWNRTSCVKRRDHRRFILLAVRVILRGCAEVIIAQWSHTTVTVFVCAGRCLLRLYSGTTGGDGPGFIFSFLPPADSDVAVWAFAQNTVVSQMCSPPTSCIRKQVRDFCFHY